MIIFLISNLQMLHPFFHEEDLNRMSFFNSFASTFFFDNHCMHTYECTVNNVLKKDAERQTSVDWYSYQSQVLLCNDAL